MLLFSRINEECWPLEAEGEKMMFINNECLIFLLSLPFVSISHSHPYNENLTSWPIKVQWESSFLKSIPPLNESLLLAKFY